MQHKKHAKFYPQLMIASVVLLTAFFIMLFNLSDLKLGKGLGREVYLITNDISNDYSFKNFRRDMRTQQIEYDFFEIDDDRLLVELYGVNDVEKFTNNLYLRFPKLIIYETATFNSISNVTKMAKTIQSYFVIFLMVFITTWTYRYRLWGLYQGLSLGLIVLSVLHITNRAGFLFDFKLWFTFYLSFLVLVLLKSWFIYCVNDDFDVAPIKNSYLLSILMLVLIGAFLFFMDKAFYSSALTSGILAFWLMVELIVIHFVLPLIKTTIQTDQSIALHFEKRDGIRVPDMLDERFLVLFLSVLIVFVSALSYKGFNQTQKHNPTFSQENFLIVDHNDAISFLEVQASLGKHDLSKNLIEYKISEEKMTWYFLDEFSNWFRLNNAKTSIEEKLNVKVSVVRKEATDYAFSAQFQSLSLIGFVMLNAFLIFIFSHKTNAIKFIILTGLFYLFQMLLTVVFNINASYQMRILQVFVPLLTTLGFIFVKQDEDLFRSTGVSSILGYALTILLIMVLPVVLIIPDLTSQHYYLLSLLFVVFMSFMSSVFVLYYIQFIKERKHAKLP